MKENKQERIQELDLSLIVFDDELQVRLETDEATIQDYYEAMETEEDVKKFPPITVYFDGCRYWLSDGRHRYWAMKRRGYLKITVCVIDGSHDDALLAAVRLNTKNGLRFKDGDWEKIIPMIADKEQWKDWTNRRLAEELQCSYQTVRRYRSEDSVGTGVSTEKRRGKDGKMYKAKKIVKPKVDLPKQETLPDTPPQEPFKAGLYCRPGEKPGATGEPYVTSSSLTDLPHDQPEVLIAQLIAHFPRDYARKCPFLILDALRANDGSETIAALIQAIVEEFGVPDKPTADKKKATIAHHKGNKKRQTSPYDVHFEPDPDDDYFDWITDEEREELREIQKTTTKRVVPPIHTFTIQNIPEHSPEPLLDCLYSLFKVSYRKKLAPGLLRGIFDEDPELARKIVGDLRAEFSIDASPSEDIAVATKSEK